MSVDPNGPRGGSICEKMPQISRPFHFNILFISGNLEKGHNFTINFLIMWWNKDIGYEMKQGEKEKEGTQIWEGLQQSAH